MSEDESVEGETESSESEIKNPLGVSAKLYLIRTLYIVLKCNWKIEVNYRCKTLPQINTLYFNHKSIKFLKKSMKA